MKVDGPPVVSEPLPGANDVARTGGRERLDRRPPGHPRLESRHHTWNLGLLQHHFRDEHRVRIAPSAPGKISAMLRVPGEERRFQAGAAYSGSLGVDQPEEACHRGGPRVDAQLRIHVLEVLAHCARGEPEQLRDLGVRLAPGDPRQHLALAPG